MRRRRPAHFLAIDIEVPPHENAPMEPVNLRVKIHPSVLNKHSCGGEALDSFSFVSLDEIVPAASPARCLPAAFLNRVNRLSPLRYTLGEPRLKKQLNPLEYSMTHAKKSSHTIDTTAAVRRSMGASISCNADSRAQRSSARSSERWPVKRTTYVGDVHKIIGKESRT